MAAYARQSVKELQALLRNRGLNARGRKNDLVQRLLEDDDCIDINAVLRADDAADEDSDIQFGAHLGNVVVSADRADNSHESNESEAIKILKLQIELERIKLQQSRVGMNVGSADSSLIGDKPDMGSIKAVCPLCHLIVTS
jgi:hypothetical protein